MAKTATNEPDTAPGAKHRELAAMKRDVAASLGEVAAKYNDAAKVERDAAAAHTRAFRLNRQVPEHERTAPLHEHWQNRQSADLRAKLLAAEAAGWTANSRRAQFQALGHTVIAGIETFAAKFGIK